MTVQSASTAPSSADWADRACEVASRHYHAGLQEEARQICIRILEQLPHHGRALYLLALLAVNNGDARLALDLIEESLRNLPQVPFCHVLKGQILSRLGRQREAASSLEHALQLRPREPVALTELGKIRAAEGNPDAAIKLFEHSLAIRPNDWGTLAGLAAALREVRRAAEAIAIYQRALEHSPGNLAIRTNLALAHGEIHDHEQCVVLLREVLAEHADHPQARLNLSRAYFELKRYEDARRELEPLFGSHPEMPEACILMVATLFHLGRHQEAVRWHREHSQSQQLLFWHYDPEATPAELFEKHRCWARLNAPSCPPRPAVRKHGGRIRVGYVSADFSRHAVGWFMRPILSCHNREEFDVYCYSVAARGDDLTEEAKGLSVWRDAFLMNDAGLAQQILEDEIDILVDLSGFTSGNRLLAFARRPAPVQVTWLGYPNTTGLQAMDYRITDPWADPAGVTDRFHTEKLFRLPSGFLCYGADPDSPEPAAPNGPLTFASFNALPKINDRVLQLWARILMRVPESRLYLKAAALQCLDTQAVMRERFAAAGIDPVRLTMGGFEDCHADHLAAYNKVDVALDTFPYNGTTTTYDALWMGVPVVALEGDSHVSRVCVSILQRSGHPEWLAATPDEYVDIAVRLATAPRPERRERLLTPAMTDGPAFTRTLETAYRDMLAEAAATPAPAHDTEALRREVTAKPFWYHKIELPGGVVTPGWAPLSRDAYRVPADLTGKRVLDVGAWDGYWTFLALQRGAREVVAIDDFSDYLGSLKDNDRRAWENFDLCRAALGYDESRCRRIEMSVYDVSPELLGRFDVVFFFGTLYHLRHPLLALDKLASACDQEIYVESAILDDFSPYRGGIGQGYPGHMVMEFYPDAQYGNNNTNWWAPSLQCLAHMVRAAGFAHAEGWKLTDQPSQLPLCRGFVKGTKHV